MALSYTDDGFRYTTRSITTVSPDIRNRLDRLNSRVDELDINTTILQNKVSTLDGSDIDLHSMVNDILVLQRDIEDINRDINPNSPEFREMFKELIRETVREMHEDIYMVEDNDQEAYLDRIGRDDAE